MEFEYVNHFVFIQVYIYSLFCIYIFFVYIQKQTIYYIYTYRNIVCITVYVTVSFL